MGFPVPPKRGDTAEGLSTLLTLVGSLPGVRPHVGAQVGRVPERFPTMLTDAGPLPGVYSRVYLQVRGRIEGFSALLTFKRLHSAVLSQMALKVGPASEGFPALLTFIGFPPSVRSHVTLKVGPPSEGFPAEPTFKNSLPCWITCGALRVGEAAVDFPEVYKITGSLPGLSSHLTRQTALKQKGFPTHATRVDALPTGTSNGTLKGRRTNEGFSTFLALQRYFTTETLRVRLRSPPGVLTFTGFLCKVCVRVSGEARGAAAGQPALLTATRSESCVRSSHVPEHKAVCEGFSTLSALTGSASSRIPITHRETCNWVQGFSTLITVRTFADPFHQRASVPNRKAHG